MSAFAVALKDPAAPPMSAAEFLLTRGFDRGKARAYVMRQPGFLGRGLDMDAARELAAAAGAAGLRTVLCDEAEIPEPPKAIRPSRISPKGGGFEIVVGSALHFVHFEAVTLFAASAYDAAAPATDLSVLKQGVFAKMAELLALAPAAPDYLQPKDTYFRADIVSGQLHLQLDPAALDFSGLGAARTHSSLTNFRLLLDALSGPCFNAVKNAFLPAFIGSLPLAPLKLSGPAACDTELSRLLLVSPRPKA